MSPFLLFYMANLVWIFPYNIHAQYLKHCNTVINKVLKESEKCINPID